MAVERFIEGRDFYGAGFVKHNTNAGYIDREQRRVTPQVFSAHSFYASQGQRLVADIQGVGDLYTDPQVLSCDYRFGEGDLGPRGMALFFKTFRHCGVSDSMGIPIFPLSRNELKVQAKYEEDEETMSSDGGGQMEDSFSPDSANGGNKMDLFQRLDLNRLRRSLVLKSPRDLLGPNDSETQRRSNCSRAGVSQSLRKSMTTSPKRKITHRTKSDVDDVSVCLELAKRDFAFSHRDFHRRASGELRERHYKHTDSGSFHKNTVIRTVSAPMMPTDETVKNLGKVHYQLAVLHGTERFPEVVPEIPGQAIEDKPSHDSFSVLFHLAHAAALQNAPACLALARVHVGLGTAVSDLLDNMIPTDFDAAKHLLRRAMSSPHLPTKPKAAAGCLLYQLLHDEMAVGASGGSHTVLAQVIEDTLQLMDVTEKERTDAQGHQSRLDRGGTLHQGDKVEANYAMEGSYYMAVVVGISADEQAITVQYDDDGSEETLSMQYVRPLIPPTATQTSMGGPLSDDEAFGAEEGDGKLFLSRYELTAELATLKEKAGDHATASRLYLEAAECAMEDGKMKTATEWSLKAADLQPLSSGLADQESL
jgi:elongation factor 2 kinase